MTVTTQHRGKPKGAKTRFKGIGRMAVRLGVSTKHLRLCLQGRRESEGLVRKYFRLLKQTGGSKRKPSQTPTTHTH